MDINYRIIKNLVCTLLFVIVGLDTYAQKDKYLIEAEVIPDFLPCFYIGTGKGNRKFRVDGYIMDDFDYTMNLVIADYSGIDENRILAKTGIKQCITSLAYFVDQSLNSRLYEEIEISTPCSDLIDMLRANRNKIRKHYKTNRL